MLDKTKALDELQLSEEEYDELVQAFLEVASEQTERLQSAVSSGNDSDVRELAHSLRGAAGNLRLDECAGIASAIELGSMASGASGKDVLQGQLKALVAALDDIRNSAAG
jgi:HPt (histidine-containing phosphotransfer) domain-containing protein